MSASAAAFSRLLWLGTIAVVALLFYRLAAHPLMETSDARYSEIAWEMVDSGDWVTPRMNGAIHLDKPPLAYWLGATGLALFGHSERAVRLPLAIAATATLLLTLYLGRWLFGGRAGLLALLLLGTAPLFVFMARLFTTDLYLTLWVVATYVAFLRGYGPPEPQRRWVIAFAAALALGMLTKGPVVLLHTLVPILPYHFLWGKRGRLRPFFSPPALATFVLIVTPWFLLVWAQHPDLWRFYLEQELVGRVTGEALGRRQPFYYFAKILLIAFLPWIFWLPFLARQSAAAIDRQPAVPHPDRLLLLWAILPFVVLSIIPSKLPPYILPLIPALALWAGAQFDGFLRQTQSPSPKAFMFFAALAAIVAIGGAVTTVGQHDRWYPETFPSLAVSFALVIASLVAFALSWRGRHRTTTVAALLCFAFSLNLTGIHFLPNAKTKYRYYPLADQLAEQLADDDEVVTYRWYFRGLPFYLGRTVTIADYERFPHPLDASPDLNGRHLQSEAALAQLFASDKRIWVLVADDDLADLQGIIATPLVEIGRHDQFRLLCNRLLPSMGKSQRAPGTPVGSESLRRPRPAGPAAATGRGSPVQPAPTSGWEIAAHPRNLGWEIAARPRNPGRSRIPSAIPAREGRPPAAPGCRAGRRGSPVQPAPTSDPTVGRALPAMSGGARPTSYPARRVVVRNASGPQRLSAGASAPRRVRRSPRRGTRAPSRRRPRSPGCRRCPAPRSAPGPGPRRRCGPDR